MKNEFLIRMGIESWRLQKAGVEQSASAVVCYRLLGKLTTGVLIADVAANNAEQQRLVDAIVAAMRCGAEPIQALPVDSLKSQSKVAILLGSAAANLWCGEPSESRKNFRQDHCRVIISYAPDAMLQDNTLKAPVWQDLQVAMKLLHEQG